MILNPREKEMYDALVQIAHNANGGICSLIARKALDGMRGEWVVKNTVDNVVKRNEQAIEIFNEVFGKGK